MSVIEISVDPSRSANRQRRRPGDLAQTGLVGDQVPITLVPAMLAAGLALAATGSFAALLVGLLGIGVGIVRRWRWPRSGEIFGAIPSGEPSPSRRQSSARGSATSRAELRSTTSPLRECFVISAIVSALRRPPAREYRGANPRVYPSGELRQLPVRPTPTCARLEGQRRSRPERHRARSQQNPDAPLRGTH